MNFPANSNFGNIIGFIGAASIIAIGLYFGLLHLGERIAIGIGSAGDESTRFALHSSTAGTFIIDQKMGTVWSVLPTGPVQLFSAPGSGKDWINSTSGYPAATFNPDSGSQNGNKR